MSSCLAWWFCSLAAWIKSMCVPQEVALEILSFQREIKCPISLVGNRNILGCMTGTVCTPYLHNYPQRSWQFFHIKHDQCFSSLSRFFHTSNNLSKDYHTAPAFQTVFNFIGCITVIQLALPQHLPLKYQNISEAIQSSSSKEYILSLTTTGQQQICKSICFLLKSSHVISV